MIAWKPNPDCNYKNDYADIFRFLADKDESVRLRHYKSLILDDLFYVVQFVMEIPPYTDKGKALCNHPFVVDACREVEGGPSDLTLDEWAREHFKSSIITIGETIQYILRHPEHANAILSYIKPVAKKFLFAIKEEFQNKPILHACFPDIVWKDPEREAPLWSLDEGLVLRRKTNRKEPTVSAWGLIEGMPTGLHFERRIYDDIVTEDIAESPDIIMKVSKKFDSSQNLGTDGGTHRVVGTPYAPADTLNYISKKTVDGTKEGKKLYFPRLKPATHDGTRHGRPVFLSQEYLDKLKTTKTFNCQQLLNPIPEDARRLEGKYFQSISRRLIPRDLFKFMLVDPAGDDQDGEGDSWAMGVFGVEPESDDLGMSRVFILDLLISPLREEEAPEEAARMYCRNGLIMQLGVEKVGLSTAEIHIANALAKRHRYVSKDNGSLVILTPAGRNKKRRITSHLAMPLYAGKWFICDDVPAAYAERLREEADNHPLWQDDGLDICSYLYDIIKDYRFGWFEEDGFEDEEEDRKVIGMGQGRNSTTGY